MSITAERFNKIVKSDEDIKILDRWLCETDLRHLCKTVLKFRDWDKCHDDIVTFDTENKDKRFKLYLLPRGHLKTSVISIAKTIQDILKNFDAKILLTSAVWNNSRTYLSEIREYLTEKSILPYLYSKFKVDTSVWNTDQITIAQRQTPNKTPTIDTAGTEKAMTSQHYDIIRADDLVNETTITTQDQLIKTKHYFSELINMLEPGGTLEVIGTRWQDADLYGHIIKNLCDDKNLSEPFVVYKRRAIENGKVIFPLKFSEKRLKDIEIEIGSYKYSCLYNNEPINPELQHFKPPFRYWSELGQGCEHILTVDLASSDSEKADYNVILDGTVNGSNQLCVVDYFRSRCGVAELIDKLFSMAVLYRVKKVGIESVAYQKVFAKMIKEECRKRNIFFQVIPIIPHKDKFQRIMALQPRWESGNLLLKQGMVELEDEFTRFPVAEHDDLLDSVQMQLQLLTPRYDTKPKVYIPPEYRFER